MARPGRPQRFGAQRTRRSSAQRGQRGNSSKHGRQPARFQAQRLADEEDSEDDAENDLVSGEEPVEDVASEDEDVVAPTARPYQLLLQSFDDNTGPKTKRRKLDHRAGAPTTDHDSTSTSAISAPPAEENAPVQKADVEDDDRDVDHVEEPEDDPTAGLDEDGQDDQDDQDGQDGQDSEEEDPTDPFDTHFVGPDERTSAETVRAIEQAGWTSKRLNAPFARVVLTHPKGNTPDWNTVPQPIVGVESLHLKHKLRDVASRQMSCLDNLQRNLAPMIFNYQDLLFCDRSLKNADSLRKLVCLHALNHILKTRARVIKNNQKLVRDADLDLRDQGFTRPKVLFLLPTRTSCFRVLDTIRDLLEPDQQENRKRFDDAFMPSGAAADKFAGTDRPADFRDLFGGNDDDMFRIGVKLTRRTLKYYAQFYNSDILLASPLGLRTAMGSEASSDTGGSRRKTQFDTDFLSSIELVVADQADALLMQNWEHVEHIFAHLNLQPRNAHGCDFGRVRPWYLEGWAGFFRQTVVLSAFDAPELAGLARQHCRNFAGRLRVAPASYSGVVDALGAAGVTRARQTFSRFDVATPAADPDARFAYFASAVLPSLTRRPADATGTLLFVPSYLDFVRVRNFFANDPAAAAMSFGALSEYASVPEASRARSHFATGRHRVLLYTERAHHFCRYRIRGVRRVIFYGLPENPVFYAELAGGFLATSERDGNLVVGIGAVKVLFSRFDAMKLERVVGTARVGRMLSDRGDTFDFV